MLISIIIPSAGRRPKFLQRAIKSALIDDNTIQTEVIVVLNGKDGMAFDISQSIQHPLVKYHKIEQGNVSKARNYGLSLAQGELIRFLDDDDYLYPEAAYQQYLDFYFNDKLEINIYSIIIKDQSSNFIKKISPEILNNSFLGYSLNPNIALPFIAVYKKNILANIFWDEECKFPEDEDWLRQDAKKKEYIFEYSDKVVGVWFQHPNERLSLPINNNRFCLNKLESIFSLFEGLEQENRNRYSLCMAYGLWSCIHGGFHFSPIYWTKIALYAKKLNPQARPKNTFFDTLFFIDPILLEWLIIPIRWISRYYRKIKSHMVKAAYVRKL